MPEPLSLITSVITLIAAARSAVASAVPIIRSSEEHTALYNELKNLGSTMDLLEQCASTLYHSLDISELLDQTRSLIQSIHKDIIRTLSPCFGPHLRPSRPTMLRYLARVRQYRNTLARHKDEVLWWVQLATMYA